MRKGIKIFSVMLLTVGFSLGNLSYGQLNGKAQLKQGKDAAGQLGNGAKDQAGKVLEKGQEKVETVINKGKDAVDPKLDRGVVTQTRGNQPNQRGVGNVADQAGDLKDKVVEKVNEKGGELKDKATDVAEDAKTTATEKAGKATQAVSSTPASAPSSTSLPVNEEVAAANARASKSLEASNASVAQSQNVIASSMQKINAAKSKLEGLLKDGKLNPAEYAAKLQLVQKAMEKVNGLQGAIKSQTDKLGSLKSGLGALGGL